MWPLCGATTTIFDVEMTCTLPKNHGYDGERMHSDPEHGMWLVVITLADGTEREL